MKTNLKEGKKTKQIENTPRKINRKIELLIQMQWKRR